MGTHQLPQQTAALSSALYSPTIHHYHHYEVRCLPRLLPARPCHGHGQRQRRYSHGCGRHGHGTSRLARHGRHQDHHHHLHQDRRAEHQFEEGRCAHHHHPHRDPHRRAYHHPGLFHRLCRLDLRRLVAHPLQLLRPPLLKTAPGIMTRVGTDDPILHFTVLGFLSESSKLVERK